MSLIHEIAQGNTDALEQLYKQYKDRVYRLALSLSHDMHLAEDITQDTFLHVQERARTYRREGSEAAWIIAIARNLTYDSLRRRSREVTGDIHSFEPDGMLPPQSAALLRQDSGQPDPASNLYFLDLLAFLTGRLPQTICTFSGKAAQKSRSAVTITLYMPDITPSQYERICI